MKTKTSKKGFTLIEILLVIALIVAIGIPASAFYARFMNQMAVRDAAGGLKGALREAQSLAMAGKEHSSWGVKHETGRIIVFRGDSFSGRNQDFDQALDINDNINISNFSETVFSYPAGHPDTTVSNINISWGNDSETFSLNGEGAVE